MYILSFDSPINKILYQETKVLVHSYFLKTNELTMFSFDYCRETNFIKKPKCLSTHICWRQKMNSQCFLLIIAEMNVCSRTQCLLDGLTMWHLLTPGTCGYLCPTKVPKFGDIGDTLRDFSPHFYEYKVIKHFIMKNSDRKRTFDMPN